MLIVSSIGTDPGRPPAPHSAHLREVFADVRRRHEAEPGRPFQAAPSLAQAYQTDLYLELIDRGIHVGWVPIHGQWREIDTVEDLERVRKGWPPPA